MNNTIETSRPPFEQRAVKGLHQLADDVMDDFIATTYLVFADGTMEGQALHRGPKEECERTGQLISALSYSGDKHVIKSGILIIPIAECGDLQVGQCWRNEKNRTDDLPDPLPTEEERGDQMTGDRFDGMS